MRFPVRYFHYRVYDYLKRTIISLDRVASCGSAGRVENLIRPIDGVARECPIIMILLSSTSLGSPRNGGTWKMASEINQPPNFPIRLRDRVCSRDASGRGGIGNWQKLRGLIVHDELIRTDFTAPCNVHPTLLRRRTTDVPGIYREFHSHVAELVMKRSGNTLLRETQSDDEYYCGVHFRRIFLNSRFRCCAI